MPTPNGNCIEGLIVDRWEKLNPVNRIAHSLHAPWELKSFPFSFSPNPIPNFHPPLTIPMPPKFQPPLIQRSDLKLPFC